MVQEVWDGTYVIVMNSRGMRVWPQMVMLAVVFPLLFGLVEPCSCRHVLDLKSNTNTVFSWFLSLTRPICLASSARRQVPRDLVSLTLSALPLSRLQGLLMQRQKEMVSLGFGAHLFFLALGKASTIRRFSPRPHILIVGCQIL